VTRTDEAVQPQVRGVEDRADRRDDRHVVAEDEEVAQALGLGALQRQCRGGRRGLEPDREEHDLAIRVLARELQRVERRVHHAHVSAARLGVEQRAVRGRHAQHVAEGREDHLGALGDRDRVVLATHRYDAHRAARPVDQLDLVGQQVLDAVLVDGVRVPAADLHQLVAAARLDQRRDLLGQPRRHLTRPELVDEPHRSATP
jgi:hypothetical protein